MRKLFPTVTALVALLILLGPTAVRSQPPAAAKGPDAATATLVTTACTACHTIDRINNKKGDAAAWTTTVSRMSGMGAGLTDPQIPQVVDYLVRNAGSLAAPLNDLKGGAAKGGGKGGGGGGNGKNIQVLQGADIPATMQSFVQALGLLDKGTCTYCHVDDRSADAKPQKVTARRMVIMMRAINGTFGDGKQHVTCYTCHRGSTTPLTTAP